MGGNCTKSPKKTISIPLKRMSVLPCLALVIFLLILASNLFPTIGTSSSNKVFTLCHFFSNFDVLTFLKPTKLDMANPPMFFAAVPVYEHKWSVLHCLI